MVSYIELFESGALDEKVSILEEKLKACALCPHKCGVNRFETETGKCGSGSYPVVSSFSPHFGEEKCLVGSSGSGTIFFTNCNMNCVFCQNYDISHMGFGDKISHVRLSEMMLKLQDQGCHNINFVTPTHMVYAILKALSHAVPRGLEVPLVYNSGGYDSVETLAVCEGVFDIYMPDFKFMDINFSDKVCDAPGYPVVAMNAIREMHRQVGDLYIDPRGIALKGLLVRHLVLPNNAAATERVLSFLAELSADTYVNIMDQYHPEFEARRHFDLLRKVTIQEYDDAVDLARQLGLSRIDKRQRP